MVYGWMCVRDCESVRVCVYACECLCVYVCMCTWVYVVCVLVCVLVSMLVYVREGVV